MARPSTVSDRIRRYTGQPPEIPAAALRIAESRDGSQTVRLYAQSDLDRNLRDHPAWVLLTDSEVLCVDANGAETLLGRGDLLYKSPTATGLSRIQAPLITEEEIESIVQRSRRFGEPAYVDLEEESNDSLDDQGEVDPELFEQAWQVILESGKTSTSYLQRRLRIGYNRAANIIELLEQKGYLGPAIGNKPREIVKRS